MSRRGAGILLTVDPASGRQVEHATTTCPHCDQIVVVPHRAKAADVGRFCTLCGGVLCPRCSAKDTCSPLEKRIAAAERRASNDRVMGRGRLG